MSRRLFTSESVTEGHPDKIADQISDTILDALLQEDPASRVAVETLITTGQVHVAGEVTTKAYAPIAQLVRDKILEIGYDSSKKGFDGASCGVSVSIGSQSPDIAQGVDTAYEARVESAASEELDELDRQGAGDQGLMFGYACDETPELMPLPIRLAHRLSQRLSDVRKNGTIPYLRPDGKTQVTIEYDGDKAVRLDTVVVSSQHASDIDLESLLAPDIREFVVEPELRALVDDGIKIDTEGYRLLVNPTGRFEIGGPMGDAGLTGRKIIIDTYGGIRPARRRRLLRQGPVQGRPLRRLRDALGRQERRRRGPRHPLRGPGRLRDRQGRAGRPLRRDLRYRARWTPRRSRRPSARSSTCAPPRSSATSTCSGRSTP